MKIDSPSHVPYLPLPAEIPALQQQESLDVDSQVNQSGVEQKNREIVAQQAGAHAHAQIQQNKFVDPSLTVQGKSQALLEQKPSVSKRGLKRSLANGFEQRDLSQGALSTAFQRAARDAQSQSGKPKGAPKHQEGVSPYSYEAQATISQQSLSSEARSPLSRSSVEAVMEAAQNALPSEIASTSSPASASPTDGVSLIQQELGGLEPSEAVGVESVVGDFSQEPTESVAKERPSIPRTLPGLESEQTLSRLSDRQLQQWVDGLGAFKDGASIAEKKPVFEQVAQQEGGRELGRLLEQLAGDNDYVSDQNVNTLGQSIASHATDDVKADFVRQAMQGLEPGSTHGVAIAQALGGLGESPELMEDLLQGMTRQQMQEMVLQATQKNVTVSMNSEAGPTVTTSYNAEPLANLLDAVAQINNKDIKSSLAAASSQMLREIENLSTTASDFVVKNRSDILIRNALQRLDL